MLTALRLPGVQFVNHSSRERCFCPPRARPCGTFVVRFFSCWGGKKSLTFGCCAGCRCCLFGEGTRRYRSVVARRRRDCWASCRVLLSGGLRLLHEDATAYLGVGKSELMLGLLRDGWPGGVSRPVRLFVRLGCRCLGIVTWA